MDDKKEMVSIQCTAVAEKHRLLLEEELTATAATASSVQNRFFYKMQASLIESCPEKNLNTTTDGRTAETGMPVTVILRDWKRFAEAKFQSHLISFNFFQRKSIST